MGDVDIGEWWHNFFAQARDQPLFGMELPEGLQKVWSKCWFRWERLPMGGLPSPIMPVILLLRARALEFAVGRPSEAGKERLPLRGCMINLYRG
jgi:hypothetical protein